MSSGRTWTSEELDALLLSMEELQGGKVIDLARRLKPGLTLEDIRNPHDFPELGDTDWHYEDGVLTGIQSVRAALSARSGVTSEPRAVETERAREREREGENES